MRAARPGSTQPAPATAGGACRLDVRMLLAGRHGVREPQLGLAQLHHLSCEFRLAPRGPHPAARALPAAARPLAWAAAAWPLSSSGPGGKCACARARALAPGSARLSSAALPPSGSPPPALLHPGCGGYRWPRGGPSCAVGLDSTLVLLCLCTDREGRLVLSPGATGLGAFFCFRKTVCSMPGLGC